MDRWCQRRCVCASCHVLETCGAVALSIIWERKSLLFAFFLQVESTSIMHALVNWQEYSISCTIHTYIHTCCLWVTLGMILFWFIQNNTKNAPCMWIALYKYESDGWGYFSYLSLYAMTFLILQEAWNCPSDKLEMTQISLGVTRWQFFELRHN